MQLNNYTMGMAIAFRVFFFFFDICYDIIIFSGCLKTILEKYLHKIQYNVISVALLQLRGIFVMHLAFLLCPPKIIREK